MLKKLGVALALVCVTGLGGISGAWAQTPKLHAEPEVYEPTGGKGPIVIMVSGNSGPARYQATALDIAALGYHTVLLSGRDVLIRDGDPPGKDGAAFLKSIIDDAQKAETAIPGKVALLGFSRGGAGVLRNGTALTGNVSAVIAYYPSLSLLEAREDGAIEKIAEQIGMPVLVQAGVADTYKSCCLIEDARALRDKAAANDKDVTLVEYEEANHAFNLVGVRWYREDYDQQAWDRTIAFLKQWHPASPGN